MLISGFLNVLATILLFNTPKLLLDPMNELLLEALLTNEPFEPQSLMSQKSSPPLAAGKAVVFLGRNSEFRFDC